jgi:chromosome partitioning protein
MAGPGVLSIALVNAKPGTGKTTSAVWLAHAFAETGHPVLLIDADPASSALEWSDLAGGFPFGIRVAGLPVRDLHRRIPDFARPDDVVIIDSGQLEDHAGIARSALRFADEVVIPCAPTVVEISRTAPMRAEVEDINTLRQVPARSAVLLNRTIARANSTAEARSALEAAGMEVLRTTIPRLELYAQSYGGPLLALGADIWRNVATDLLNRAEIAEMTR